MFGSIKAITNLALAEHGIGGSNSFFSIYITDEMRCLLALISETGMRLSEAERTHKVDIILEINIRITVNQFVRKFWS
jgi:integrase